MIYALGNKYFVRALQLSDLEGPYPSWFEDQEICKYNSHGKYFKSANYYRSYIENIDKASQIVWAICHESDGHIGNVSLQSLSFINRSAEFAIIIGNKDHIGKGLSKMAGKKIIEHGFYKLNLERIYCGTADTNSQMKALAKSLGMVEEGRRRKHIYLDNMWVDIIEYGLLRKEASFSEIVIAEMKVAVVCYHAGGAEIISSYIAENDIDCSFVLDGPAIKVFSRRFGDIKNISSEEALMECDSFLTGTGCVSNWEWNAIQIAKNNKKYVVSFIDHWVNYHNRFVRNGIEQVPDEVWVGDQHAYTLARKELEGYQVKFVDNPYFKEVKKMFGYYAAGKVGASASKNILYVCENINKPEFHQNDSIRYMLENISRIIDNPDLILIRPHPSEESSKYKWLCDEYDLPIEISTNSLLIDDIKNCKIVAGCTSMAMVIGLLAKKRVVSCIPDNKTSLTLPFQEIEMLSHIIDECNI